MLSTSGKLELFMEPKADNGYLFYYFVFDKIFLQIYSSFNNAAPNLDYEYRGINHFMKQKIIIWRRIQ
jgi:hypothetical protein